MLTGCVTALTTGGAQVRIVSEQERAACKFIGTVSGSMSLGARTAGDADSALNEARNKAANLGANAIRIINMDSNEYVSTATAEALRCELVGP
jgi:uncharacterized protein YbjQ (UPF0145 family)